MDKIKEACLVIRAIRIANRMNRKSRSFPLSIHQKPRERPV